MKRSLSIRAFLGLSHGLLLIISLGAIGFIWSRNEYRVITSELLVLMRERATLIARVISHEIQEHDAIRLNQTEFPEVNFTQDIVVVYIDDSGPLYNLGLESASPEQVDLLMGFNDEYRALNDSIADLVSSKGEPDTVYAAAPVVDSQSRRVGELCILMPLGQLDSYILRLRWMLIGAIWVVVLLGVGVSTVLTNYFSRQFSRVQRLAATLSEGDYHVRIPEAGPTELRELSGYMNVMAEKLEEQLKTRRTLLANVTHELARPLAGLQLGIESLRKGAIQDPNLSDDLLVNMEKSIDRLKGRVEDLVLAAQPATQPVELHRTAVAVEPFLKGTATYYGTLADAHSIRLEVQVDPELPQVFADEKRLHQIIGNLVDNAIKFTSPGKTIKLLAEREDENHVRLMVHDGGEGMTPWEREHIFEPFYQGDTGRRIKQGMGLGLSIARQLAEAHEGNLTLENHPDGGMLATLTLPIAET